VRPRDGSGRYVAFVEGDRVEIVRLIEDPAVIEETTGYKVRVGLKGRVTNTRPYDDDYYVEVKLDRGAGTLAFHASELRVIG